MPLALRVLAVWLVGAALLLLALEGALALALRAEPEAGAGGDAWRRARRDYYQRHERHIVQYLPECAHYDPRLAYRLKPGACRFRNREFDHEIIVNSAGLRDTEAALAAPRIVVAGDSFAMGWGVAQPQALPALLGELTGEPTLNAAQPSYGSARQLLLLRTLDLTAAHTLVIQYCENDFIENARYLKHGGELETMPRDEYEATLRRHRADTAYWPGKHLRTFAPLLWRAWRGRDVAPDAYEPDCELEAQVFRSVLWHAVPDLPPLRLVVLEAMYSPDRRSCFVDALARETLPGWVRELHRIDTTALLDADDYYPLDEHWNASGHREVARAIAARLGGGAP